MFSTLCCRTLAFLKTVTGISASNSSAFLFWLFLSHFVSQGTVTVSCVLFLFGQILSCVDQAHHGEVSCPETEPIQGTGRSGTKSIATKTRCLQHICRCLFCGTPCTGWSLDTSSECKRVAYCNCLRGRRIVEVPGECEPSMVSWLLYCCPPCGPLFRSADGIRLASQGAFHALRRVRRRPPRRPPAA